MYAIALIGSLAVLATAVPLFVSGPPIEAFVYPFFGIAMISS